MSENYTRTCDGCGHISHPLKTHENRSVGRRKVALVGDVYNPQQSGQVDLDLCSRCEARTRKFVMNELKGVLVIYLGKEKANE